MKPSLSSGGTADSSFGSPKRIQVHREKGRTIIIGVCCVRAPVSALLLLLAALRMLASTSSARALCLPVHAQRLPCDNSDTADRVTWLVQVWVARRARASPPSVS